VINLPTNRAGVVTADSIRADLGQPDKPIPARLTTQQVADHAGVTAKTVGYWVATKKLTPLRYGGPGAGNGHVFSGAAVAAFLHQRANGGAW
jgi:hypothetical protein